jgi:organic hydroperoxide reductase OsmC/OhrA
MVAINAENMLVAAVSSAHMLSWLNVAFGMGIEVVSYLDQAHGVLSEVNRPGEFWVSEVILHPRITFDSRFEVSAEAVARVHELAHEHCFIARSIKAKVTVRSASE